MKDRLSRVARAIAGKHIGLRVRCQKHPGHDMLAFCRLGGGRSRRTRIVRGESDRCAGQRLAFEDWIGPGLDCRGIADIRGFRKRVCRFQDWQWGRRLFWERGLSFEGTGRYPQVEKEMRNGKNLAHSIRRGPRLLVALVLLRMRRLSSGDDNFSQQASRQHWASGQDIWKKPNLQQTLMRRGVACRVCVF